MENLNFILFHPVSICIYDDFFKYEVIEGMFYPCLIGAIKEDNICVDIISGKEYDIVEKDMFFSEITSSSKIAHNPVYICRKIDNSLENLRFIENYVKTKGKINQNIIKQYPAFSYRLNRLLCIKMDNFTKRMSKGFWYSFHSYKHVKYFLKKLDNENSISVSAFLYIQSGEKANDDLAEKNNIISNLRKILLK